MIDGLGDREVHAVAGARQAGKTTMLMQLAARLVAERGVDPRRIMYISLDEPPFLSGARYLLDALEWYAREVVREQPGGITERLYVMLDEIQEVDGWQSILKRWVDLHRNAKFLVSGSSSIGMLSGASESLAGRIRYQQVMPMSFPEYASLKGVGGAARAGAGMRRALAAALDGGGAEEFHGAARSAHAGLAAQADELRSLLSEYLEYGGRPGVALEGDPARKRSMLTDQLQLAIYKDIVRTGGVRDPASIDTLLSMLAWRSPQIVNTNRLGGTWESTGARPSTTCTCSRPPTLCTMRRCTRTTPACGPAPKERCTSAIRARARPRCARPPAACAAIRPMRGGPQRRPYATIRCASARRTRQRGAGTCSTGGAAGATRSTP